MFVCADAQHIPFRECVFDAVMSESVTTFAPDRGEAVTDYARVLVLGGRVGINEELWHEPPTESMVLYVGAVLEIPPGIPDSDEWVELFRDAGLADITTNSRRFRAISQFLDELGRYRPIEYLFAVGRFFSLVMTNRTVRRYLRTTMLRAMPKGLLRRLGYGLFVGVKGDDTTRQRESRVGY